MLESIDYSEQSNEVADWATKHNLGSVLFERYKQVAKLYGLDHPQLDMTQRGFCEMPLCNTVIDVIRDIPEGFQISSKVIKFGNDNVKHYYFLNPFQNTIICITPGQFSDYLQPEERFCMPESRIDYLRRLIIESKSEKINMIRAGSSFVLHGDIDEINTVLGIDYSPIYE